MAPSRDFSKSETDFWQQRSSDQLTAEAARQMTSNLAAYARLLEDWGCKESSETNLEHQEVVQS